MPVEVLMLLQTDDTLFARTLCSTDSIPCPQGLVRDSCRFSASLKIKAMLLNQNNAVRELIYAPVGLVFSVGWTKPVGLILRECKENKISTKPVGFFLD